MNRLASAPDSIDPTPLFSSQSANNIATLLAHRDSPAGRPPHSVFVPMHYEPGYAYPLVVWLHGSAGNEHQLPKLMPLVSMRNYVAVAPRATNIDRRQRNSFHWRQTEEDIETAETRVFDCIALAEKRFNIHGGRIFLAGYGGGGTMAVRIAWSNPGHFAGVASIGGKLPTEGCPLNRINDLRRLPCLLATTRNSAHYPERDVCRDLRLLHAAGCTVALRQYPGGDDLTTAMLGDLNRWLMELVCSEKR